MSETQVPKSVHFRGGRVAAIVPSCEDRLYKESPCSTPSSSPSSSPPEYKHTTQSTLLHCSKAPRRLAAVSVMCSCRGALLRGSFPATCLQFIAHRLAQHPARLERQIVPCSRPTVSIDCLAQEPRSVTSVHRRTGRQREGRDRGPEGSVAPRC